MNVLHIDKRRNEAGERVFEIHAVQSLIIDTQRLNQGGDINGGRLADFMKLAAPLPRRQNNVPEQILPRPRNERLVNQTAEQKRPAAFPRHRGSVVLDFVNYGFDEFLRE